jgi:hypothetical protein
MIRKVEIIDHQDQLLEIYFLKKISYNYMD